MKKTAKQKIVAPEVSRITFDEAGEVVINYDVVNAWVFEEKLDICPISGMTKHPAHYIHPSAYQELNQMELANSKIVPTEKWGSRITSLVKIMFQQCCDSAKKKAAQVDLVDVIAVGKHAHQFIGTNQDCTQEKLETELEASFGSNVIGIKSVATRVFRQHLIEVLGAKFHDWLKEAGKICLENTEKIVEEFVYQCGHENAKLASEAAMEMLDKMRSTGQLKQLVFDQHINAVNVWVTKNGMILYVPRAIDAIMTEPDNSKLNKAMLNAAYLTAKNGHKEATRLTEEQHKEELKQAERNKVFELHLSAAKQYDDGTTNTHDMAEKIMGLEPTLKSFKMLVAAILTVRKNTATEEPFHAHTPNLLKEGIKNPGSAKRKTKEPRQKTAATPEKSKKKEQKSKKNS